MPQDPPIACSLAAADLSHRLVEMAAVGAASLIVAAPSEGGASLRFRDDPGTRERLAAIVDAEAACCAFLDLTLTQQNESLVLAIRGPAEASHLVDELVHAFGSAAPQGR